MKKELLEKWLNEGSVSIPNLLLQHYNQVGLDEIECLLIIQIYSFINKGVHFPTPDELSERMTLSSEDCMQLIRTLIHKDILYIEEHKDPLETMYSESYSLAPLWKKLATFIANNEKQKEESLAEESLYTIFENEFARPLSPIECETLAMWIDEDKHSADLITAALKESVLSGKLNFRYIDRILFEWKKNGIKTVEEAHAHSEKFRQSQQQRQGKEKREVKTNVSYPFYNWL